jgi:hypothetical protein
MRSRLVLLLAMISWCSSVCCALADATPGDKADPNLPKHVAVCESSAVSRKKLANYLIIQNKALTLANVVGEASRAAIFTDGNVCPSTAICDRQPKSEACQIAKDCLADLKKVLAEGNNTFAAINENEKRLKASYSMSAALRRLNSGSDPLDGAYAQLSTFFSGDPKYGIACTTFDAPTPKPPYDPAADKSILSKIRVRGLSDDLWIDRTQGSYFKATNPATGSFTGNTNTPRAHTSTFKINGAFGYAFDTIPQAQIVPYVSLNQALTETQFKPRVLDPTNNVALGVLGERYLIDPNYPDISHLFLVKPRSY